MAVIRLFLGLRADKERCRGDELAFVVLPCSSPSVRRISVLANEPFGVRIVHRFHESALGFRGHGRFADAQRIVVVAKE